MLKKEDGGDAEGSSDEFDEVVALTKDESDDEACRCSNGSDEEESGEGCESRLGV